MLWIIRRFLAKILGDVAEQYFWKYRRFLSKDWRLGYLDKQTITSSHRAKIVEALDAFSIDTFSLLEVGCGSGANLVEIRRHFPNSELAGIDINADAVRSAQELVSSFSNRINITENSVFNFNPNRNYDFILFDAVLMYFNPVTALRVIEKCKDSANIAIIIVDQLSNGKASKYNDLWVHPVHLYTANWKFDYQVKDLGDDSRGQYWKEFGKYIILRSS